MGTKSKGRGTAAAFGLLLLFAGLIGGSVLFALSMRRHDQAVRSFARAPVGCTTTLDFTETGTFYVYREDDGLVSPPLGGCVPTADPLQAFGFELSGSSGAVVPRRDESISYDTDTFSGRSVARVRIDEPGQYDIEVVGADQLIVAAIGRDPDDGVDALRRGALIVGGAGVVLGGLLLVLAGWRSKRAAILTVPGGPGWGPRPRSATGDWPPEPPRVPQVPVNPHEPDEAAAVAPAPLPSRSSSIVPSPWAPPSPDDTPDDLNATPAPPAPVVPTPSPKLPKSQGRISGVSPNAPNVADGEES